MFHISDVRASLNAPLRTVIKTIIARNDQIHIIFFATCSFFHYDIRAREQQSLKLLVSLNAPLHHWSCGYLFFLIYIMF